MSNIAGPLDSAISKFTEDGRDILLHGYRLTELIGNLSYPEIFFLALRGRLPTENEGKALDACLTSASAYPFIGLGSRLLVMQNPNPVLGLVNSLLSVNFYGGTPQHAMEFITGAIERVHETGQDLESTADAIAQQYTTQRKRVPGLGHPHFRGVDPRAERLREVAQSYGFYRERGDLYEAIQRAYISKNPAKADLCLNIEAALAVVLTELGFRPYEGFLITQVSLMPVTVAQYLEIFDLGTGLGKALSSFEQHYIGPDERPLPEGYKRLQNT